MARKAKNPYEGLPLPQLVLTSNKRHRGVARRLLARIRRRQGGRHLKGLPLPVRRELDAYHAAEAVAARFRQQLEEAHPTRGLQEVEGALYRYLSAAPDDGKERRDAMRRLQTFTNSRAALLLARLAEVLHETLHPPAVNSTTHPKILKVPGGLWHDLITKTKTQLSQTARQEMSEGTELGRAVFQPAPRLRGISRERLDAIKTHVAASAVASRIPALTGVTETNAMQYFLSRVLEHQLEPGKWPDELRRRFGSETVGSVLAKKLLRKSKGSLRSREKRLAEALSKTVSTAKTLHKALQFA